MRCCRIKGGEGLAEGVAYSLDRVADRRLDTESQRVSIREAARILAVSESAIHKRVQRGTLPHDKDPDGRVFVYLDTVSDTMSDHVQHPSTDALISEMHSRIESLERQLEKEREANSENRRIIAALTQRIPEIEAPRDSPTESPDAPETTTEDETSTETPASDTGQSRRSWWRRWFGFE